LPLHNPQHHQCLPCLVQSLAWLHVNTESQVLRKQGQLCHATIAHGGAAGPAAAAMAAGSGWDGGLPQGAALSALH